MPNTDQGLDELIALTNVRMENQSRPDLLDVDCNVSPQPYIPAGASSGLQYSALASLTSTDSVLHDLPTLSIAFPEFRLMPLKDKPMVVSQHTLNFERQYLSTVVSNADTGKIRFQPASQITPANSSFLLHVEHPLSSLAQSVLDHCITVTSKDIDAGHIHELPRIDPYDVLGHLLHLTTVAYEDGFNQDSTLQFPIQEEMEQNNVRTVDLSLPSSLKRPTQDEQDRDEDETQCGRKPYKKTKSRLMEPGQNNFTVSSVDNGVMVLQTPSDIRTTSVSVASVGSPIVPSAPENDPAGYFEDLVLQCLKSTGDTASGQDCHVVHLSSADLKQLGLAFEHLSKRELLADVPVDALSELLKYLDTSMENFTKAGCPSWDDNETMPIEQTLRESTLLTLEYIVQTLDHVKLSITIFNGNGLQQHLFPEELLVASLTVFKSQVETFLAPALLFSETNSGPKRFRMLNAILSDEPLKAKLQSLLRITSEICERLCQSDRADFSDGAIVKLVYTALSLFFIDTSDMALAPTEGESLKQSGSSLLRMIYARYPDHRITILEEIMSSLIKLPHGKKIFKGFRSNGGPNIHSFSALLMQLVQAIADNPLPDMPPMDFLNLDQSIQRTTMEKLLEDVKMVTESVKSSTAYIFNFLLARCTKGAKSSLETDYRSILDSLLSDLLAVIGHPEWPIAELFLFLFGRAMAKYLDDGKSDSACKAMAIDSLGLIAAKIKTSLHQLATEASAALDQAPEVETWRFFGELDTDTNLETVIHLQARYTSVVEYLSSMEAYDSTAKAAKNVWATQWITAICSVAVKCSQDQENGSSNWELLASECFRYWKLHNGQERSSKSKVQGIGKDVFLSASYLTARQQLFGSFDMVLSRILGTLEAGAVTLRAKSLKALSIIVAGDHAVLAQHNVRKTIAVRLQDQSPSVRDAAAELVGRYMVQDATIRKCYYDIVSERVTDAGLSVRKRVVKLLRDLYPKADSVQMRNDIAQRLLLRVHDEETTVRDLAVRSVADTILGPFLQATSSSKEGGEGVSKVASDIGSVSSSQKRDISRHARSLVDMVGKLSVAQDEALSSVIQKMMKADRGRHSLGSSVISGDGTQSFSVIVDSLIDLTQTLQEEDASKSSVAATLHTLHTFVKSEPQLVEARHLSVLMVHFHCAATPEDWRITMIVLRIYQDSATVICDMTLNDLRTAEKLLLALVAKCPAVMLPEAVSVLCLMAREKSVGSGRLCKFFQTCMDLVRDDIERLCSYGTVQENKLRRLVTIVGLVCKHFPFEQVFKDDTEQVHLQEIKAKMPPTVQDAVFNVIVRLCEGDYSKSLRQAALQSLGFVIMSFPDFFDNPRSVSIMDSIFESQDVELKTELLQLYANFLVKIQSSPTSCHGDDLNHSLVANPEDHLEVAIGNAVMQRYLDRILRCALVHDRGLQTAAVDVISQVTLQALAHPALCMPAIVALETSSDAYLSDRGFRIHQELHQKHPSLIYSKSMECVRTAYSYQCDILGNHSHIQGYKVIPETGNITALLNPFYSLVGDMRQIRNALLLALVKVLDPDLTASEVEVDGNYCRFIAENIASLDYKSMEEVYLVVYHLNRIIAGTGMTIVENARTGTCTNNLRTSEGQDTVSDAQAKNAAKKAKNGGGLMYKPNAMECSPSKAKESNGPDYSSSMLAQISIAVEMAVLLKGHLRRMYDISETRAQQFHPTAHVNHKEKPVPRFTGLLARIQWHWNSQEVDVICRQTDAVHRSQGDKERQDLIEKQLERFQVLMETETKDLSGAAVLDASQ